MNINSTLLDSLGRTLYSVGGETAFDTGLYKGYAWSLEWFIGSRSTEPMLAIWPANKRREDGVFGICMSSIGKYAEVTGMATPEAMVLCFAALKAMSQEQTIMQARKLLDVIHDRTSPLLKMTPAPVAVRRQEVRRPLIEVELMLDENGDKSVREVSL